MDFTQLDCIALHGLVKDKLQNLAVYVRDTALPECRAEEDVAAVFSQKFAMLVDPEYFQQFVKVHVLPFWQLNEESGKYQLNLSAMEAHKQVVRQEALDTIAEAEASSYMPGIRYFLATGKKCVDFNFLPVHEERIQRYFTMICEVAQEISTVNK